ncbi:hypothetical protein [Actinomyces radicidentis]|uniref:hypothetical protein n=1 Tax=Actinomyces radicidentis TaxID=111015 RepID=UPI0028E8D4D9|nr:hypothetical protein [Actinomyces radicidentis]
MTATWFAVIVVLLLVAGYFYGVGVRGRHLVAAGASIDEAWRGVEASLVGHHQAAESLVRAVDERGLVTSSQREAVESAVADAARTGTPSDRARRESRLNDSVTALSAVLDASCQSQGGDAEVKAAQAAYEQAWDDVDTAGARYNYLVPSYNRLTHGIFNTAHTRRTGRRPVENLFPGAMGEIGANAAKL